MLRRPPTKLQRGDNMAEELETRILRETIAGTLAAVEHTPAETGTSTGGSWQVGTVTIGGTDYWVFFANGYFDLSGYTQQDKTLFTNNALVQQCPVIFGTGFPFSAHVISTEPLNLDDFEITDPSGGWALPGTMSSSYSLQQIILGSSTSWALDSSINTMRAVNGASWGVGDSTAREKLYYAVAYAMNKSLQAAVFIPDTTFVVPAIIDTEEDLEYMMRLKRSVETV